MTPGVATTDRLLGQILAERYQILHRLGEGAMGVVYKARHVKVGRLFAVKLLHTRMLADPKVLLRFEREAELAGRLRHPNVIGVVDVGEVDGMRYMVMDFAEGPDLARLLDEAPMTAERIIRLVRQMLEGLYHAHEQGLIHRDFKPENVIVERDSHGGEVPRIVDFGIALLREGGDAADRTGRLTTNGLVLGTPHYMAPEQAVADPIDHRIDLFALGIVVYEMLSGRLPFDGSGAEVARANLLIDPPPIRQRVPHLEVDPLLEAFSRRLMAKKRTARPATAKAARELLDLIERDRPAAARQLGVPVARSERAAVTEEVVAEDAPTNLVDLNGATMRMRQTPRPAAPVVLATGPLEATRRAMGGDPLVPDGDPTSTVVDAAPPDGMPHATAYAQSGPAASPDGSFPRAMAVPQAMSYAPSPAGLYGSPHRRPHRDTTLRTPLGWQTASLPTRRSWLIGGLVVGALSILTATVLTLTRTDGEPRSSDRVAISGSSAVASAGAPAVPVAPVAPAAPARVPSAPITAPTTAPITASSPPIVASPAAEPAPPPPDSASPDAPAREPGGDGKRPVAAPARSHERNSEQVSRASNATAAPDPALRHVREREPEREPEVRAPDAAIARSAAGASASTPARPDPGAHETRAARPEPPRDDGPPVGLTPTELGRLYDSVNTEIAQLPKASQGDVLAQLALLNIMRVLREAQPVRDDAAAQLWKLRQRLRDRKAGR
ncbi:MAG TPA: serine/threonine-protein kinase [Kofleriaceae bacterium]|jgi:tRNA A-37 threonylcarbamoyl transferase component Bud32|nr:serine/threonine-protein kinase [Kofleriaceae bacterium]